MSSVTTTKKFQQQEFRRCKGAVDRQAIDAILAEIQQNSFEWTLTQDEIDYPLDDQLVVKDVSSQWNVDQAEQVVGRAVRVANHSE